MRAVVSPSRASICENRFSRKPPHEKIKIEKRKSKPKPNPNPAATAPSRRSPRRIHRRSIADIGSAATRRRRRLKTPSAPPLRHLRHSPAEGRKGGGSESARVGTAVADPAGRPRYGSVGTRRPPIRASTRRWRRPPSISPAYSLSAPASTAFLSSASASAASVAPLCSRYPPVLACTMGRGGGGVKSGGGGKPVVEGDKVEREGSG